MILQRIFVVSLLAVLVCSTSSMTRRAEEEESFMHIVGPGNENNHGRSMLEKVTNFMNDLITSKKNPKQRIFNVDDFGAKGDGSNDTMAFLEAWKIACKTPKSIILVPSNKTYVLKPPIKFLGPCKSKLIMRIHGTIKASSNMKEYEKDPRKWVSFEQVQDLTVDGGGTFNGNGKVWWESSCKINNTKGCHTSGAPTAATFDRCTNLRVTNLRFLNSQQIHVGFQRCRNVDVSDLTVIAPQDSPNTDGIHVSSTEDINIKDCIIGTGDDCISIVSGSKNVRVKDIMCGPGHGISIGSLGKHNSRDTVSDIHVQGVTLWGTTNGVRIKTWQGGQGYAKNIQFVNIKMMDVSNPIIIDQNYCDQKEPCLNQTDAVQVKNIVYKNIRGTSNSELAMKYDCSKHDSCQSIRVENIRLFRHGDANVKSFCANGNVAVVGDIFPPLYCQQST
ncbi:hypothetical protein LIER_02675 [Lithospermum erythrorhizon]|uniref:endo-polygalacturonase n=1 Tax=Lithospermum erythrorhizon TaxID=34254 RepID=A0AAV3NR12_LITER